MQERTTVREFENAHAPHRAAQSVSKSAQINSEQRTNDDPDRSLMRNDQHIAVMEAFSNLFDHPDCSPGDHYSGFASCGWIPRGISCPEQIIIMKLLSYLFPGSPLPRSVCNFLEAISQFRANSQSF